MGLYPYFHWMRYSIQLNELKKEDPRSLLHGLGFKYCVIDNWLGEDMNKKTHIVKAFQSSNDASNEIKKLMKELKVEAAIMGVEVDWKPWRKDTPE